MRRLTDPATQIVTTLNLLVLQLLPHPLIPVIPTSTTDLAKCLGHQWETQKVSLMEIRLEHRMEMPLERPMGMPLEHPMGMQLEHPMGMQLERQMGMQLERQTEIPLDRRMEIQ